MSEKKGTIVEVHGEFFLQTSGVGARGKKEMLKIGSAADKDKFAGAVGQKVGVILSEPVRSVVAVVGEPEGPFKRIRILCYIPVPDLFYRVFDQNLINQLTKQFVDQGIISETVGKKIMS